MTDRCQSSDCPGGNCPGCRNSILYCQDPRCYPDCPGCDTKPEGQSNWWLTAIVLVLLGVLLVLGLVVGFGWFRDRKKAAEPKQLTLNKHIHTVTPPSIVVSSPAPVVNVTQTPQMPQTNDMNAVSMMSTFTPVDNPSL